jgi:predicted nucleic acid-binding protein
VTVVVDASVLAAALLDSGKEGRWAEGVIAADRAAAPELVLVEVSTVLRRLESARAISAFEANAAQRDLMRLDLELFPYGPFAERIWELRDNVTAYDGWYVALAEALHCSLATLDKRLTRAAGTSCDFLTPG